jgi:hypothetical protein
VLIMKLMASCSPQSQCSQMTSAGHGARLHTSVSWRKANLILARETEYQLRKPARRIAGSWIALLSETDLASVRLCISHQVSNPHPKRSGDPRQ